MGLVIAFNGEGKSDNTAGSYAILAAHGEYNGLSGRLGYGRLGSGLLGYDGAILGSDKTIIRGVGDGLGFRTVNGQIVELVDADDDISRLTEVGSGQEGYGSNDAFLDELAIGDDDTDVDDAGLGLNVENDDRIGMSIDDFAGFDSNGGDLVHVIAKGSVQGVRTVVAVNGEVKGDFLIGNSTVVLANHEVSADQRSDNAIDGLIRNSDGFCLGNVVELVDTDDDIGGILEVAAYFEGDVDDDAFLNELALGDNGADMDDAGFGVDIDSVDRIGMRVEDLTELIGDRSENRIVVVQIGVQGVSAIVAFNREGQSDQLTGNSAVVAAHNEGRADERSDNAVNGGVLNGLSNIFGNVVELVDADDDIGGLLEVIANDEGHVDDNAFLDKLAIGDDGADVDDAGLGIDIDRVDRIGMCVEHFAELISDRSENRVVIVQIGVKSVSTVVALDGEGQRDLLAGNSAIVAAHDEGRAEVRGNDTVLGLIRNGSGFISGNIVELVDADDNVCGLLEVFAYPEGDGDDDAFLGHNALGHNGANVDDAGVGFEVDDIDSIGMRVKDFALYNCDRGEDRVVIEDVSVQSVSAIGAFNGEVEIDLVAGVSAEVIIHGEHGAADGERSDYTVNGGVLDGSNGTVFDIDIVELVDYDDDIGGSGEILGNVEGDVSEDAFAGQRSLGKNNAEVDGAVNAGIAESNGIVLIGDHITEGDVDNGQNSGIIVESRAEGVSFVFALDGEGQSDAGTAFYVIGAAHGEDDAFNGTFSGGHDTVDGVKRDR